MSVKLGRLRTRRICPGCLCGYVVRCACGHQRDDGCCENGGVSPSGGHRAPNDQLERPPAAVRYAPRAHNRPALAAQSDQVSRPLQALVRRRLFTRKQNLAGISAYIIEAEAVLYSEFPHSFPSGVGNGPSER